MYIQYIATCIRKPREKFKLTVGKDYDVLFYNVYEKAPKVLIVNDAGKEVWYLERYFKLRKVK